VNVKECINNAMDVNDFSGGRNNSHLLAIYCAEMPMQIFINREFTDLSDMQSTKHETKGAFGKQRYQQPIGSLPEAPNLGILQSSVST
jgi:hypothetical protein